MGMPFDRSMTEEPTPPNVSVFAFKPYEPIQTLHFPLPTRIVHVPRKRFRPTADVDGEHSSGSHKKKRRLRLLLVTSRLSLPFSQPASNIVDRGSSKIAVWAKQRSLGRNLLRKAAIINRIRTCQPQAYDASRVSPQPLEAARQMFTYGSPDPLTHPVIRMPITAQPLVTSPNLVVSPPALVRGPTYPRGTPNDTSPSTKNSQQPPSQIPRRDYVPLPPSPLGLSNYDALDLDEDFDEDDGGCDWSAGFGGGVEQEEDDYGYIETYTVPSTDVDMNTSSGLSKDQSTITASEIENEPRSFAFVCFEH